MKTIYTQNKRKDLPPVSLICKYAFLLSILLVLQFSKVVIANDTTNLSHHVIIMIDRSSGMQQEYNENTLEDVFSYLNLICFEKTDNSIGRPLLVPHKDYLSVIGFGLKSLDDKQMNAYITTSNTSGCNFGYTYKKDISNSSIQKLYNSIDNCGGLAQHSNNFFNLDYGFPTVALPMGLNSFVAKHQNQQFHRTFIVRISDKELNSSGVGFELRNYENRLNVGKVKGIDNELKKHFNLIEIVDFDKMFKRKPKSVSYKGAYYHVEAFQLVPNAGISASSLVSIEKPLVLQRGVGGKYKGRMEFSAIDKPFADLIAVDLNYMLNGQSIAKDKVSIISGQKRYEANIKISSLNKDDQLSVVLSVSANYASSFYPGTVLSASNAPEMKLNIEAVSEAHQKIFGLIPIANWMMFANNQTLVNSVFTSLIILLILLLAFIIIRMIVSKPYETEQSQFNINSTFETASLPYDVDLNDDREKQELLFSIRITRNAKYILTMFEKNPACVLQKIGLQLGDNAPKVIADNFHEIFELALDNGQKGNAYSNIQLANKEIDLDVMFYPHKISVPFGMDDVQGYQRFDLQFLFQANSQEAVYPILFPVELNLIKEEAGLSIALTKSPDFTRNFIYAPNVYEFGRLMFTNNSKQGFAYPLNIKDLKITIIGEVKPDYSDAISIDIEQNSPFIGINDNGFFATQIKPNESKAVILDINLDKIRNPSDADKFSIKVEGKKQLNGVDFIDFEEELTNSTFVLEKNKVKTELFLTLDGNEIENPDQTEVLTIEKNIGFDVDRNAKIEILSGRIGNRAIAINNEHPTSLMLKDFEFTARVLGRKNPFKEEKANINIEDVLYAEISSPTNTWRLVNDKLKEEIELINQNDSELTYAIGFKDTDFDCLDPLKENKMDVVAKLSYKMAIKTPEHTQYKTIKHEFAFVLKRNEGEEWMSIDFGTSAIVARYGDGREDNSSLDLQARHQDLVDSGYDATNIQEFDTTFLSSSMLLNKKHMEELSNEKYFDKLGDAVLLSPTMDSIKNERQYLAPYLKALIGFDRLPDIYQDRLKDMGKLKTDANILVTHIIKSAYDALFNKYLEPIIYDEHKRYEKNKIVLSVPNDFTLEKKNLVKKVVLSVFKDAWENYIKFVSESDAIAWYYASYYDQLIRKYSNAIESKPEIKEREKNGDTVLVYDMGAGTLDLTLFSKKPLENNNYELEVLGKIGMTTGGNYLDTVLAEVAYDEMIQNNGIEAKDYFHPTKQYEDDYNVVVKYKYFIKDKLKPALNTGVVEDDEIFFTDSGQRVKLSEIDLDNIKKAEKYQAFIDKVTIKALDLLKQNIVRDPGKIKSLVISGRGGQLYGLKEALMAAVKNTFNSTPLEIVPEANEMKSMVAKGALEYARFKVSSNNVFKFPIISAHYGYIIKRGAETEYHKLIAPKHNEPFIINPDFSEDKKGLYFENDISLNNVSEIVLVQTYYYDGESILDNYKEDNHGNFYEASSVIYKLSQVAYYRKGSGTLKVFICEDTEVFARLEADGIKIEAEPKVPSIIDIQNSSSFKRSMWPIV